MDEAKAFCESLGGPETKFGKYEEILADTNDQEDTNANTDGNQIISDFVSVCSSVSGSVSL